MKGCHLSNFHPDKETNVFDLVANKELKRPCFRFGFCCLHSPRVGTRVTQEQRYGLAKHPDHVLCVLINLNSEARVLSSHDVGILVLV